MFLDQPQYPLLQHCPLGFAQRLGGKHNYRDVTVSGIAAYRIEERQAIHARHQKVEQDHAGTLTREALQSGGPIRNPVNLATLAREPLADQFGHVWVIVDHKDAAALRGDAGKRSGQSVTIKRFQQDIGRTEPVAEILLVHY